MKTTRIAAWFFLLSALPALASNLVLDGSFEGASLSISEILNGPLSPGSPWTVTSSGATHGVRVLALPNGLGPADPLTIGSPDVGGTHVVYFDTDDGINTLSQTISGFVPFATYEVSFDAYLAFTGRNNPGTPNFLVTLDSTQIANFLLTSLPIPSSASDASAWRHFSGTFTALTTTATMNFNFNAPGTVGKDILLDRVYVGVPVTAMPEPETVLLTGLGVAALLLGRFRNKVWS